MFRRWIVWACLLCSSLAAELVEARDIYVDNIAGDDHSSGDYVDNTLALQGPVRTIAKALRLVQLGDRVILANTGEPYREAVSLSGIRLGGAFGRRFVLVGNGAVLDGSTRIAPEQWEHYVGDVFRFRPARLGHQQLFLDDRPAKRRPVASPVGAIPQLDSREWCLTGEFIYFCVEPGKVPDDYHPSCSDLPTGITLYHVQSVDIFDLVVQGFQLDGINAHDGAFDILLSGVTSRGNGRSGISIGGSSQVRIEDSVLGDNGTAQLRTEGFSHTRVSGSELIANTAPALVDHGGELSIDGKLLKAR